MKYFHWFKHSWQIIDWDGNRSGWWPVFGCKQCPAKSIRYRVGGGWRRIVAEDGKMEMTNLGFLSGKPKPI